MRPLRALCLYGVLTLALTYPLAFRLHVMEPGDPAFFAWVMAWELRALKTAPETLPHANIFHPLPYTLGMDEPVLGTTILVLPFSFFTQDAVLLFGLARLLTFVISGLSAYLLARELGSREGVSLLAGAAFAFSPIRTVQLAHLSTLGTQWLPLVLLFMHRFARKGRTRDALLSALFYVLSTLACGYHGLIGLAVLPLPALVMLWGRWDRMARAGVAVAVAALGLLPLHWLHQAALSPQGHLRGERETILYSASLETFVATSPSNLLYGDLTRPFQKEANEMFPGLVLPLLIVSGAYRLWRRRRWPRRDTVALLAIAVIAALVALGPEVRAGHTVLMPGPAAFLREAFPAFKAIRVFSRAGIFVALALVMLAARALRPWARRPGVLAAVAALVLAETLMIPVPGPAWAQARDSRAAPPPVYRWLAAQADDRAVVELPMLGPEGIFRKPIVHESTYLLYSTHHWKRLVNGYAGIEPMHYKELRWRLASFPSGEALESLRQLGTRYVILHRKGFGPNRWARIARELRAYGSSIRETAAFEDGDKVLELLPETNQVAQNRLAPP